jgi:hypothetical protein
MVTLKMPYSGQKEDVYLGVADTIPYPVHDKET